MSTFNKEEIKTLHLPDLCHGDTVVRVETVHLSDLCHGDTVVCNDGLTRTVDQKYIKKGFMGWTYYSDQYRKGIDRVLYKDYKNGQFVGYVTQR